MEAFLAYVFGIILGLMTIVVVLSLCSLIEIWWKGIFK